VTGDTITTDVAKRWIWDRREGYHQLARFASVAALQGLGLVDRDAYQELAAMTREPGGAVGEAVRETTERLYEHLRSREYPYSAPMAYFDSEQQIRDPAIIHQDSGTCLDLSLMFASMCVAAGLRPFIAILEGPYGDHALVVVDLASTPPGIGRPSEQGISGLEAPVIPEEPTGVSGVRRLAPVSAPVTLTPDGVAVEVTLACGEPSLDFTEACRLGAARLTDRTYTQAHLIDVLICHEKYGEAPLPAYRPAIYPSLPPMPPFTDYRSRERIADDLREATGIIVLLGDSGTGKSMLAHRVASMVDHGCGWFLDASTQQALTAALAAVEGQSTGRTIESIDGPELRLLAGTALDRLKNSTGPWAVVLDNANGDPRLLRPMPQPAAGLGQLLIITTTNPEWDGQGHRIVRLPALPPDEVAQSIGVLDVPVGAIAGRPLFIEATRRFHDSTGRWWWTDHPADTGSASAVFWSAVADEIGDGATRTVAQAISWLPPVRIPVTALVSVDDAADVRSAVSRLRQLGLIDVTAGEVTMHRLFRSAVRDSALLEDGPAQAELITRMLRDDSARKVMEFAADLGTAREMAKLFNASPDTSTAVPGLYELGRLFERHGTAADSANWYATFLQRAGWVPGNEMPGELRLSVVNALVGMARAGMRALSGPPDDRLRSIQEAIRSTQEAERLSHSQIDAESERAASRAKAMRGLLLRKRAALEPDGSAAGLAFLRQAELELRESYGERIKQFEDPAASPELDRSQFNLAGLEVRLAQRDDPANAAAHLEEALWHYTAVLDARRRRYRTDELEEIACCIHGQALVLYYQAILVPGTMTGKTALLRTAAERAEEAVTIRQRLAGSADDLNTTKSLSIQAQITLARMAVTEAAGTPAERDETAIERFRREKQTLQVLSARNKGKT
jgi:hypothetical protein